MIRTPEILSHAPLIRTCTHEVSTCAPEILTCAPEILMGNLIKAATKGNTSGSRRISDVKINVNYKIWVEQHFMVSDPNFIINMYFNV